MSPITIINPLPFGSITLPKNLPVLALAPHPDDFDAVGVSMRFLKENGNPLHVAVATSGASGVEDTFVSPPTLEAKSKLREQEQQASCGFFGLPEANLAFLRLEESQDGHPLENEVNFSRIKEVILSKKPAMVFLPHWNDTNLGHQHIYSLFQCAAQEAAYPLLAFLNRDPKTIHLRCDVYNGYDQEMADWKAELLRFHQSQHQRNLNQRGFGFDERILRVDRESAELCLADAPYAEVFEMQFFGSDNFGMGPDSNRLPLELLG